MCVQCVCVRVWNRDTCLKLIQECEYIWLPIWSHQWYSECEWLSLTYPQPAVGFGFKTEFPPELKRKFQSKSVYKRWLWSPQLKKKSAVYLRYFSWSAGGVTFTVAKISPVLLSTSHSIHNLSKHFLGKFVVSLVLGLIKMNMMAHVLYYGLSDIWLTRRSCMSVQCP